MTKIKRIYRCMSEDERARAARVRDEILADLRWIMADSRRCFAHASRVQELFAALRKLREVESLSLADLSVRTGINKSTLSRLESGTIANPSLDTLVRYTSALGKSVYVTIGDDPPRKGRPKRK